MESACRRQTLLVSRRLLCLLLVASIGWLKCSAEDDLRRLEGESAAEEVEEEFEEAEEEVVSGSLS
eukprot:2057248-Amphidinium_carterae.1